MTQRDSNVPTQPSHSPSAPPPVDTNPRAGARLGAYTLIKPLGHGGMGTVYLARQENPDRDVALKLIRREVGGAELRQRFEYEARVLGRLQHPGIAQIHEAGTVATADGETPFFAMEYVAGQPLSEFTTRADFGVRRRLALFAAICDAVQHAHTKGVIHRDLKPSNILVTADAQPKILDFGVARATEGDLSAVTQHTVAGQVVGTIPYMSPEQIAGDSAALDTRSDVYALGVILYELLAGRLPYEFESSTLPAVARVIREVEPVPLGAANRALRGELEVLTGKALEKERRDRYQSAAELAADVRRYLRDEPIHAHPPSAWYRWRKFARRRRPLVISIAVVALSLVGGIVGISAALVRALEAEARAETLLRDALVAQEAEAAAREAAEQEAATAAAVNAFLDEMLSAVNPEQGARDVTVRQVLDEAAARIASAFPERPVVSAAIRRTIGRSYLSLGLYQAANEQLRAALALRREHLGPDDPATLEALNDVATALQQTGEFNAAEALFREALAGHRRVLGDEHLATATVQNNLGLLLARKGNYPEAERYLRDAWETVKRLGESESRSALDMMTNLASLLHFQGKLDASEELARENLAIRRRVFGNRDPGTLVAVNNLGTLLAAQGDLAEAEPYYYESLELSRQVLGAEHPDTLMSLTNVAGLLRDQDKLDEAEARYREAYAIQQRVLGEDHIDTISTAADIGVVLMWREQYEASERWLRDALAAGTAAIGDDTSAVAEIRFALGDLLRTAGRAAEAVPELEQAAETLVATAGESVWKVGLYRHALGEALLDLGRNEEAYAVLENAYRVYAETAGPDHRRTRNVAADLAEACRTLGKLDEAAEWAKRAEGT